MSRGTSGRTASTGRQTVPDLQMGLFARTSLEGLSCETRNTFPLRNNIINDGWGLGVVHETLCTVQPRYH